jgi:hypothetical protein
MTFPTTLTNAVDGVTEIIAAHLNNLEAKVGIDGSAVVTSLDYLLKNAASHDPGHLHTHANLLLKDADDHTQYALLAGRAGGQTLIGGTAAGENLTLQSTAHATKGKILFGTSAYDEVNNRLGIGTALPGAALDVSGDIKIRTGNALYLDATAGTNRNSLIKNHSTLDYLADLLVYPSAGTNVASFIDIVPKGAGYYGYKGALTIYNTDLVADATNYESLRISGRGTGGYRFDVFRGGTGTLRDIIFDTTSNNNFGVNLVIKGTTGNVGIGVNTFGTSAAGVLGLASGTAPTTAPADLVQLWCADVNGAAGYAGLHKRTETTNLVEVVPGVVIKTNTGDSANAYEGLMQINTFDNTFKVYAEAGWRQLATW